MRAGVSKSLTNSAGVDAAVGGLSARGFIEGRNFRQECFLGKFDRSLMKISIRPEIRAGGV
jgi:hypothetical protein